MNAFVLLWRDNAESDQSMGIFCKTSINEAFEALKAKDIARSKDEFWFVLSKKTADAETGKTYKPETVRGYLDGKRSLDETQIAVIKRAGRALNVELKLVDDRVQAFVMEAQFINAEHTLSAEDRTKNRIEPGVQSKGTHGVTLRSGFKTVRFGEKDNETGLYSVQLIPDRCQVQIVTLGQVEFDETDNTQEPTPFRFLGKTGDPSVTLWDVSDIASADVVEGTLGTFSGRFTEMDTFVILMDENDLKIGDIKNTIDSQTPRKIDEALAQRIEEQRRRVLEQALIENASGRYKLVVRPLLESD